MHTLKRAAIIGFTAVVGIVGTAGVSQAAWYNDNDTRQDTQDCEDWVVFAATEVSSSNVYHRQGGAAEAEAEADEICDMYAYNGFDTTDITWHEYVTAARYMGL